MGPPIPTIAELSKFASSVRAKRKEIAKKLLTDRVMTREELIKLGLMSKNDVHEPEHIFRVDEDQQPARIPPSGPSS